MKVIIKPMMERLSTLNSPSNKRKGAHNIPLLQLLFPPHPQDKRWTSRCRMQPFSPWDLAHFSGFVFYHSPYSDTVNQPYWNVLFLKVHHVLPYFTKVKFYLSLKPLIWNCILSIIPTISQAWVFTSSIFSQNLCNLL